DPRRRARASRRSWCGAAVSFGLLRLSGRRIDRRVLGRLRRLAGLVGRLGQLDGPGTLLRGVDLEKAGAVIAAREAILDAANGEFLVARAHEGLARPFAATIVIDGIDIIITGDQLTLHQRLAAARRQV